MTSAAASANPHSSLSYRPEIDGLRAIAVLAVIVYHLDPSWLPGGFLGVDIFFVISGYLITAILQRQMTEGTFSLKSFWLRRFKRLYPALAVMVGTVLLVGGAVLVNPERNDLLLQAAGALLSFENVLMWQTTDGYWGRAAENIALLHCWSLSLEEQFYILFPLLLLLIHRFAKSWLFPILAVLALGSFLLCLVATPLSQSASFYLLPTRMWELLMGSLLAAAPWKGFCGQTRAGRMMPYAGLGLILGSLFWVEHSSSFPGYWPVFACAGTLMLLQGSVRGRVQQWLSHPSPVFIGKISYSLYLWHWPVIVFSRFLTPNAEALWVLVLTFVLGTASFYLVESPLRLGTDRRGYLAKGIPAYAAVCALACLLLPQGMMLRDFRDLTSRESLTYGKVYEATEALRRGENGVRFGKDTDERVDLCLLGSSHARVLGQPLEDFAKEHGLSGLSMAVSGVCVTLDGPSSHVPDGADLNRSRLDRLRSLRPKVTLVAGQWNQNYRDEGFEKRLVERLGQLAEVSDQVVVVGQVPLIELPKKYEFSLRKYLMAQDLADQEKEYRSRPDVTTANAVVERAVELTGKANLRFVNPHDLFLREDHSVRLMEEGRILYFDNNHINDSGAGFLFKSLLRETLAGWFTDDYFLTDRKLPNHPLDSLPAEGPGPEVQ